MKKILSSIFLFLLFFKPILAEERSKVEIKNGIFLEDVETFGSFKEIDSAPQGMFKEEDDQFVQMSKYSQEKIGLFFIKQKNMLDKYPENLMLGMGYFEFFYMQQLKDHKKDIIAFKKNTQKLAGQKKI